MAAPVSTHDFVEVVRKSGLVDRDSWQVYLREHPVQFEEPKALAHQLVRDRMLTAFQAKHLLAGRHRGLILGQYRLLDQIGKGGTGVVFLAEHVKLRRRVALKVLPTDRSSQETLERFYREARAVAALDHPNIVRAHDVNHEGKIHFLVMEYVEGHSLKTYVEEHGALPIQEAADYVVQVADGLQHAHERGLIHRDIKPANLLLDHTGTIKILDMGLALFFQEQDDTLTRDLSRGAVLGTADYLSPEQALDCHEVDIRSDIYSLGATFYTLLSGQPPFHASKITQKLIDHQIKEAPPLHALRPGVPRTLSNIVARMMAKKPEDRFQTPAEVIEAVVPWTMDLPPESVQGSARDVNQVSRTFSRGLLAAGIVGVAIVIVGAWWLLS